jgi:hypothetical protein
MLDFAPPSCDGFAFSRVEIKGKLFVNDHSKFIPVNQAFLEEMPGFSNLVKPWEEWYCAACPEIFVDTHT